MSLIDRINNAREAGVVVNVLADAKKYLETGPEESIDILTSIARACPSFVHLLSFTELKFLTDVFVCREESTVDWHMDVLTALSDALNSLHKGTLISPLIDLLHRYAKSNAITVVLSASIDSKNEETHSRHLEFVSLLSRLPDSIVTISLGSRSAHECSRRLAAAALAGVKEGLYKAWRKLKEGTEGHIDLRVLSSILTKGRHMRVNGTDTLISSTIYFLLFRLKSDLWDEIAQSLVVRSECSVLEEEQIVSAVLEGCSSLSDYKRFFGHWLTRCKSVHRACTVQYVVQRPLAATRTSALIEYVDWAGGMECTKDIAMKLMRILSTRMGVSAPEIDALHRVRVLMECGRRMRERDEKETATFWNEHYPLVMQATRLHIENTDVRIRERGMVVAESVSMWMSSENHLQFEYSEEGKEIVEELRRRARGQEVEVRREVSKVEEEKQNKEVDCEEIEEEHLMSVREMDSDDTDDEVYERIERNKKKDEMISGNYEDAKVHSSPSYLREALEWIATEKEKYDKFEAGLAAIEVLFRKRAVGWNEVGLSALRTLIHLEDRFASNEFQNTVLRSMVAIVVGQPSQLAPFLAETVFERNVAMKQRYLITTVLVNAAKELSGIEQSGEITKTNPHKEYDAMRPATSKREEIEQPDWVRVVSERVRANTRRFSTRPSYESSSEHKKTSENKFARIADRFILPLLKSKVGEHIELTGRDIALLVRVLYTACELLTLAEHSPSITRLALSLTGAVETLRYHEESSVREVVVAAYFAAATVLPEETLAIECKSWLEYCISRINDGEEGERGRRLAEHTTNIILMRLRLDGEPQIH